MKKIDVSIILPCYNQAKVLENSVKEILNVFDKIKYNYEIIIAEDGSTDGSDKIAEQLAKQHENIKLIQVKKRLGKGAAIANAIRKSKGKIAGFVDTDLETSPHYLPMVISQFEKGFDIVTTIRVYKSNIKDVFLKFGKSITHNGYVFLFRLLINVNLKDTETDCKFFVRKKILSVLDETKDKHWFWDTELMVLSYLKGFKIKELPTLFIQRDDHPSTVNLFRDSITHFIKLIRFRRKLKKKNLI